MKILLLRLAKVLARDHTSKNWLYQVKMPSFSPRTCRFTVKGQQGFFGKFLPKMLKRDLMYMEDR